MICLRIFLSTLPFCSHLLVGASASDRPPNVVLIFTDDQGYQDLGCFGAPRIKTPHLDRMAAEGMKFTDFYSASPVCSASRAALLTGCYPPRVGIEGVLFPKSTMGLHPDEITVAELLKSRGYATTCIGKWHLGHKPAFLPTRQGFDTYLGIPYSNDMLIDPQMGFAANAVLRKEMTLQRVADEKPTKNWTPLLSDEHVIEYPVDQSTLTRRYTQRAVQFIHENRERPFFLYLPHTMPHIPLHASDGFRGRSAGGLYGDVIEEIDWSTGEILAALKEAGVDDQTLVLFTSDNGPWNLKNGHGGSAAPLRGYKFQTFEGGMRVPCLMRWPGTIPSGSVCSEVAATIDVLPTLAKLAGATIPNDRIIDGRDIADLMRGTPGARSPHDVYFYYKGNAVQAVRAGRWKLHRSKKDVQLFDLSDDASESTNVADQHRAVVEVLSRRMEVFHDELIANRRPAGVAIAGVAAQVAP